MDTIQQLGPELGIAPTCAALGVARATFYRQLQPPMHGPVRKRANPMELTAEESAAVLAVLHEERFIDLAPAEVYATLLGEGRYLCSERTMYRVLAESGEVRERRDQLRHPKYAAPELLATAPNQLWSWDITKLLGPAKWTYFYLYVVLDVFSRYVVGWLVADAESSVLAERLMAEACERQGIVPGGSARIALFSIRQDVGTRMLAHSAEPSKVLTGLSQRHVVRHAQAIRVIRSIVLPEADVADLILPAILQAAIPAARAGNHRFGVALDPGRLDAQSSEAALQVTVGHADERTPEGQL